MWCDRRILPARDVRPAADAGLDSPLAMDGASVNFALWKTLRHETQKADRFRFQELR
jgi:hypothetical protein